LNNKSLYVGREHSLIKHELLKSYLEKLLFIVARGGVREITYIDCFAGPWGDESVDLEGTSISISLNILSKVKASLEKAPHNKTNTKYRAIFVEKDESSYKKLKDYLDNKSPANIQCHAIQGDYYEHQDEILKLCGSGFAFFFIDPKGWSDVGIPKL
jgi:three-Cys-motif partner protein